MLTPQFVLNLSAKLVIVLFAGAGAISFPPQHIIERGHDGRVFSKSKQVAMIGNAVPPLMQYAVTAANFSGVEMRRAA